MLRLRHVLSTGAATLLSGGLSLGVVVLAARLLGPEQNGYYAQYVIVLNLVWLGLNFGFGPATTYFLASGQLSEATVVAFNRRCLTLTLAGSVIVLIAIRLAGLDGAFERVLQIPSAILTLGVLGGVAVLALNQSTALQMGRRAYDRANLLNVLRTGAPLPVIAIVGLLSPTSYAVAAAQTVAIAFVALWSWSRIKVAAVQGVGNGANLRAWLAYGGVAYLSNVLHYLAIRGLLLGFSHYATPAEVGFANLALLLLEALLLLPSAIGQLLFPSSSSEAFDPRAIAALLRLSLALALVIGVAVALWAPLVSVLVLGDPYLRAGDALRHLAPSVLLMTIPRILSPVLSGRGKPQYPLYGAIASVALGTLLALWLMPTWGLLGTIWVVNAVSLVTAAVAIVAYAAGQSVSWLSLLKPSRSELSIWVAALRGSSRPGI